MAFARAFAFSALLALLLAAMPAFAKPRADLLLKDTPPAKLSALGLFQDARARIPAVGVEHYTLNTPLFSDYAAKERFIFLPPGGKISYRDTGVLEFPVGTALIKTFAFPADFSKPTENVRLLETRLLVRQKQGWAAWPYVWNAAGTEATFSLTGATFDVAWTDAAGKAQRLNWVSPNKNQCKACHAHEGAITPIGPKAGNLNRPTPDGSENQLARWTRLGLLTGAPAAPPQWPAFADAAAPLNLRARAYLDVNCAHCHNPAGPANNSGLTLTYEEADPSKWGVLKRPVAAGRASGGLLYSIAPGDPDASILAYRMASTDPGVMMPETGRTLVHEEGLALIRQWIKEMK
jgi:uncharacterized repeat protein (TIGR03806 family)